MELGYGPITAPSVSVTGAGSLICACFRYLHLKKKKKRQRDGERDRQGPFLPEQSHRTRVLQDKLQHLHTQTEKKQNKTEIIYDDVKTSPSVQGSADKAMRERPMENKQRSFSHFSPVSSLPASALGDSFGGPVCMRQNGKQLLRRGSHDGKVKRHLARSAAPATERIKAHTTRTRSVMYAVLSNTNQSALRNALLRENITPRETWPRGAGWTKHVGSAVAT